MLSLNTNMKSYERTPHMSLDLTLKDKIQGQSNFEHFISEKITVGTSASIGRY